MKKLFTLIAASVFALTINAQPIITSAVLPLKGDTILMSLDSTIIPPGLSGTNVSWDFSTAIKQDIFIERVYLDPANTPYANLFPSAKLCRTDGIGSVYSYWDNSNSSKSVYYGFVEKNIYDQNYNNIPLSYYKFPITYGNAFTDTISAITNPGGLVGPGKYFFIADGWGSLKLPNKTVPSVLRTKSLIYIGDSNPPVNSYSLTTEYAWYQAQKKEPLLVISTVVIDHVMHKKFVIFDNSAKLNLIESSTHKIGSIFPNPAQNFIHVEIDNHAIKNETTLSIIDITGLLHKTIKLNHNNISQEIDIQELAKGFYSVQIEIDGTAYHQKFIKN